MAETFTPAQRIHLSLALLALIHAKIILGGMALRVNSSDPGNTRRIVLKTVVNRDFITRWRAEFYCTPSGQWLPNINREES